MPRLLPWPLLLSCALLSACSSVVTTRSSGSVPPVAQSPRGDTLFDEFDEAGVGEEIVLYAYGLLGTGYRFGGRNPEAGLDCSGMVSYIVEQVTGRRLPHNAAQIARQTRIIAHSDLRPGDLVFFNTLNRPYSHMGIYLGEGKFIHAPSSRGVVRVERMDNRYFARRYEGARTLMRDG